MARSSPWRDSAHGALVAAQDHGGRVRSRTAGTSDVPGQRPAAGGRRLPAVRPQGRGEGRHQLPPRARQNTYVANFEGVVTNLERRYRETDSEYIKTELEKFMVERPCPVCKGKRLKPEVLGVTSTAATSRTSRRCPSRTRWPGPRAARQRLSERERTDRAPAAQGDPGTTRLPGRRWPRLPDHRPDRLDAVGRRGAAHPARDPDRLQR